jgi:hypothetical protein
MRTVFIAGVFGVLPLTAGLAADKMSPDAIKTAFFTGQEFMAATPSGVKFKMSFTPDGKVTRTPAAGAGARGEGNWKVSKERFSTTWKGAKANCYRSSPSATTSGRSCPAQASRRPGASRMG